MPDAVSAANGLRDRVMVRFLELLDRVRTGASGELRACLRDLCHGVRGNNEWGLRVPRDLSQGHWPDPMENLRPAGAQEPSDTRPGPIEGAPSIAWWWDRGLN